MMETSKEQLSPRDVRTLAVRLHQEGRLSEAVKAYRLAILLFPRDTRMPYNLGNLFRSLNQNDKAMRCYELVLKLEPNDLATLGNLAPLYRSAHRIEEARLIYERILAIDPEHQTAHYFLDAIAGRCPEHSPKNYVVELFDRYAPHFEQHIQKTLGYRGPSLLRSLYQDTLWPKRFQRALDLGCGTGLALEALRSLGEHWTGVDLSPGMIAEAQHKELYQELYTSDAMDFLVSCSPFDLIVAADLLPYFGPLEPLMKAFAKATSPKACILFSTEEGDQPVTLQLCGRFQHNFGYVRVCAEQHGFRLMAYRSQAARQQAGSPVVSGLYLLQKAQQIA